ncbi:MAG TPA: diguanylate cyclase [bacterium]
MEKSKINVLIAEDNPKDSFFWERIIAEVRDTDIEFNHLEKLSEVRKHLGDEAPDVILLDLSLSGSGGLEVFLSVYEMAPTIPIIVVTGTDDQKLAVQTALAGAQDSLVKSDINGYLLSRSMRYAIGRQIHLQQLRSFSVIDEMTGLYNRRGFLMLADQQIKMADRRGQSLLLVFADMDGLKTINDNLGHHRGDLALMETAHVLREAFRETDILGRLGGDEFVALLTCSREINEESLIKRFQETMDEHNSYRERSFKLSVSIGIALYDPRSPCCAADLLVNADSVMYKQKNLKKAFGNLQVFAEMKDPVRSVLAESLADTRNEAIVRLMLPILRKCGLDAGISLQLSSWMAKGSRELKQNLIQMIEDIGDASGGPALRMALFDDSEEIATLAARAVGKINFIPGLPVLLKAAKIWKTRFPENKVFLIAVCESLGDLAQPEGVSFLQDIASEKPLLGDTTISLPLRRAAIHALTKINRPDILRFLEEFAEEKDPQPQEALKKII